MTEWEAEIKIRRNGRLVKRDSALGDDPEAALWLATCNIERWAQDESRSGAVQ